MPRNSMSRLAADLGIDDEEAGEREWAHYLTDSQLAEAIERMRPESAERVASIASYIHRN